MKIPQKHPSAAFLSLASYFGVPYMFHLGGKDGVTA